MRVPASAVFAAGLAAAVPAAAQVGPAPAPAKATAGDGTEATPAPGNTSAPTPTTLQRVEITGNRGGDTEQRRASTAAKIVVGREEIDRYGDATVGDLLKRLPGVTVQGRPGRGGAIRMRGLGNGYTQILLDGERVPPGFSLDSMSPEQIERIEILRAPTAETGARAIAGTINIVTREGFTKRINDLRATAGIENGRLQPGLSWTRNDTFGGLTGNVSLSASGTDRRSDATTTTVARRLVDDAVLLDQRDDARVDERRTSLHATARLQWRGGAENADSVTLMPLAVVSNGSSERRSAFRQAVGITPLYDASRTAADSNYALLRMNGQWNHRLAEAGRIETKFGLGQSTIDSSSRRVETTAGAQTRTLDDDGAVRDRNVLGGVKWVQLLNGEHSLVAGTEAEANRRSETRTTLENGAPLLADFGDTLSASSTRLALYAQDEWNATPQWALHAGLRWEGIATRGSADTNGASAATNRSSVWTPLLHAVWRPEAQKSDQLRISLTRSYRSPTLSNLIARPTINNRYPLTGENTATQPDRVGNPALRPELATGIDVAVEHFLPSGGLVSANVFVRRISDYMRSVTSATAEVQPWSDGKKRYVSRMQNVGDATTQGLELEAKFRLSDLLAEAPKIDLRANASVFRSRVQGVPGPDNRLDQQPGATANFGLDYRFTSLPLTIGGNLNWTPGYETRVSEVQTLSQGRVLGADAYGLWVFNPQWQLRVTASNLGPRNYLTGGSVVDTVAGSREKTASTAPTWVNLQVRLEVKL
jgi:outer membrane receptor for ferrienterochelin and colicins